MKTIASIALILFFGSTPRTSAQSNGNSKAQAFSDRSAKLLQATGLQLNKQTGEWVKNKNVIDDRESPPYWAGHTSQSFNWLQFATLNHRTRIYHVLIFEKPSGRYKNDKSMDEWVPDTRTYFFVMSDEDFNDIRKLALDKGGLSIKISSGTWGFITNSNGKPISDPELLSRIANSIDTPVESTDCMILTSQMRGQGVTIRFLLPASCYLVDNLIKSAFFEISQAEFLKWLD